MLPIFFLDPNPNHSSHDCLARGHASGFITFLSILETRVTACSFWEISTASQILQQQLLRHKHGDTAGHCALQVSYYSNRSWHQWDYTHKECTIAVHRVREGEKVWQRVTSPGCKVLSYHCTDFPWVGPRGDLSNKKNARIQEEQIVASKLLTCLQLWFLRLKKN